GAGVDVGDAVVAVEAALALVAARAAVLGAQTPNGLDLGWGAREGVVVGGPGAPVDRGAGAGEGALGAGRPLTDADAVDVGRAGLIEVRGTDRPRRGAGVGVGRRFEDHGVPGVDGRHGVLHRRRVGLRPGPTSARAGGQPEHQCERGSLVTEDHRDEYTALDESGYGTTEKTSYSNSVQSTFDETNWSSMSSEVLPAV